MRKVFSLNEKNKNLPEDPKDVTQLTKPLTETPFLIVYMHSEICCVTRCSLAGIILWCVSTPKGDPHLC